MGLWNILSISRIILKMTNLGDIRNLFSKGNFPTEKVPEILMFFTEVQNFTEISLKFQ